MCPGDLFIRQRTQHDPGRLTSAHRQHKAAARGDCRPRLFGDDRRGSIRNGLGIHKYFNAHKHLSLIPLSIANTVANLTII